MNTPELIPHLFRTEYRKIVSVLCRRFGFDQIEIAEDITSETFLTAVQTWGVQGNPENPVAWLYHVAKNKAKNHLQQLSVLERVVTPALQQNTITENEIEVDLSPQNIDDSQLQMMFAICNPAISTESQIGLSLRILCGFGIEEIADAFFLSKETINKRLFRAKEKLRQEKIEIKLPALAEIDQRLDNVLTTIYLLFNEGYYSVSQNKTLRKELCREAMRLCIMLVENELTNKPKVNALLALMCFHASRFEARLDQNGELVLYEEQSSELWNTDLIAKGGYFLSCAATGKELSKYHLEAGIAYWNTIQKDTVEKWEGILRLYDQLLLNAYSPVAALNRTYAVAKVLGKQQGLKEAEKLNMTSNQFYYMLLGELYTNVDDKQAILNFQRALSISKSSTDKIAIQKKIDKI